MKTPKPAIWLIALLVGVPMFSETVYTPSLPDIAHSLHTTDNLVEFTLTIYLLGIALGVLFWGKLSDQFGRKPCVIAGILIFLIGCTGCYYAESINTLIFSRFIQALGGSVGSVLGQAICRDAYHGPELGKVYAITGSALAIFPALGPIIGGIISEYSGWSNNFLFLIGFGGITLILVGLRLPETHHHDNRQSISLFKVAKLLSADKKVIGSGLIVACCNGINFSYFAEGSFYMIELLGLSPSQYGSTFIIMSLSTLLGGKISHSLLAKHTPGTIMRYGTRTILSGTAFFSFVILSTLIFSIPNMVLVSLLIIAIMFVMAGSIIANSIALSTALTEYKWCSGTASSLLGCFYYAVISLITLGMSALHDGTLFPMPFYFLGISLSMIVVQRYLLNIK